MRRPWIGWLSGLLWLAWVPLLRAAGDPIDVAADAILQRHVAASVVVVGEMHGTREAPALVAALAGHMVESKPLTVALEIPAQEQTRIDAYLASDGSVAAQHELLGGAFWRRPHERSDGRRSEAIVGLIAQLRALHAAHPTLRVLAFDDNTFFDQERSRDALMADALRSAFLARPEARLLVLTGNYHARLDQPHQVKSGDRWIQPPPPMAGMLQDLGVVSIYLAARAGEYWGCRSPEHPCGSLALRVPPGRGADDRQVSVIELPPGSSFHQRVELPRFHASPPVVVPSPRVGQE